MPTTGGSSILDADGRTRSALSASREHADQVLGGVDTDTAMTVGAQLGQVSTLLEQTYGLRRALADDSSSPDARAGLARRLLGGQVAEPTVEIVATAVAQRWSSAADLVSGIADLAAEAVLTAADKAGATDEVEDELFRFARTLDREPRLSLALSDPGLPMTQKTGLLDRLLEGKAQPATRALIEASVGVDSGRGLDARLDRLTVLAASRRQRLIAVVRVAVAPTEQQLDRLRAALATIYGRDVHLQIDLDPSVLGGVVVQVGDEILDGSVARRIEQARARL